MCFQLRLYCIIIFPLQWRHNERDRVSNHQPHDCLFNRLFTRRSKKTSKVRVTGFCVGNSPLTGEFPAQRASNAENVSIWWRHHACKWCGWRPVSAYDLIVSSGLGWTGEFWHYSNPPKACPKYQITFSTKDYPGGYTTVPACLYRCMMCAMAHFTNTD